MRNQFGSFVFQERSEALSRDVTHREGQTRDGDSGSSSF